MAITLLSSGTIGATEASTTLGLTVPTIAANDIGIWHTHTNKSTFTHVYPAGWTSVGTVLNELVSTRTLGISFAWIRFTGSESASTISVKHGGASTAVLMSNLSVWRGVSTAGDPYSTQVSTTANSSIYNTEGVTAVDTDKYLVVLGSNADDQANMAAMSSGSGVSTSMTLGYSTEVSLGNGSIISMFHSQVTSSGVVQGGTMRMGTIEAWSAFELLLAASTEVQAGYWTPTAFSLLGVQ